MIRANTVEADDRLHDLLSRLKDGEVTITQNGEVIARVTPEPLRDRKRIDQAVAAILEFGSRHTLGGESIKAMIDEGRR